uniref:Uncharacterized protein n=1 Tax=Oryza glumipatula TaxID=40148 RepID=A0A0E0BQJ4_9ORYZ
MVGAEGWRRLMRRCSSYRGCSSSTNGGRGRGVGGCVKATAYARVTRVGDDGMDETLLSNLPYNSDHGYRAFIKQKDGWKRNNRSNSFG